MPAVPPELPPFAALFLPLLSLAGWFAAATVALRVLAKYLLEFSPSWRRCFGLSCAATLAALVVGNLVFFAIGGGYGGLWILLLALLAVAAIYARLLRPPENAPPPWKFFAVAALQFVAVMIVNGAVGWAALALLSAFKIGG